jgi:hypothetical protein
VYASVAFVLLSPAIPFYSYSDHFRYLGDTEVFRTSTAEPKRNGIRWVYEKDMSQYVLYELSEIGIYFKCPNI